MVKKKIKNKTKEKMTICALVHENGAIEQIDCAQGDAHLRLGGPVVFVGVVLAAQAVILAREAPDAHHETHAWSGRWPVEEEVRGPLFIAASDRHGCEVDLVLKDLLAALPLCMLRKASRCDADEAALVAEHG